MIKYKVIEVSDSEKLEADLNIATEQGWQLWCPPFSHQTRKRVLGGAFEVSVLVAILRREDMKGYDKEEKDTTD